MSDFIIGLKEWRELERAGWSIMKNANGNAGGIELANCYSSMMVNRDGVIKPVFLSKDDDRWQEPIAREEASTQLEIFK